MIRPNVAISDLVVNLHFDRSFWSEVGLEDFLESLSSIDVNTEGSSLSDNVGFSVDELK